jgi:hypothetical protein
MYKRELLIESLLALDNRRIIVYKRELLIDYLAIVL